MSSGKCVLLNVESRDAQATKPRFCPLFTGYRERILGTGHRGFTIFLSAKDGE